MLRLAVALAMIPNWLIDAYWIAQAVVVEQIVNFPPEIQIRFFVHMDAPRDGDGAMYRGCVQ